MTTDYFDELTVNRARLVWTVATRRQLERWEPLVAAYWRDRWAEREPDGAGIWLAQIEHHFALVAARNLVRALEELGPTTAVLLDPTIRDELIEARDLHEHWVENLPVFNVEPRVTQPQYRSGKDFAERNPDSGAYPYWWLGWNPSAGAWLQPNVPALALHGLIDAVEAEVLASDPALSEYVPPRALSPWLHENGEWWPKGDDT